jgi:lipid-binding SYLF domain-containing protein
MKKSLLALAVLSAIALPARADEDPSRRLADAAAVFTEIMHTPDKGIPHELLDHASCIAIVPGMKKAGFIVGAKYGKGYVTCRTHAGWSAPATIRIEGGSVGFQIGATETDVVLLIRNHRGMERLLSDQFTLGGDATVAAGPVGRDATAQTDAMMSAEILAWSRSRGLFAGISLQGATLRQDLDDNEKLYGRRVDNREILTQGVPPPPPADRLLAELNRRSPTKE